MEKIKARRFYVLLVCLIIVFLATGCGKHPSKLREKVHLKLSLIGRNSSSRKFN